LRPRNMPEAVALGSRRQGVRRRASVAPLSSPQMLEHAMGELRVQIEEFEAKAELFAASEAGSTVLARAAEMVREELTRLSRRLAARAATGRSGAARRRSVALLAGGESSDSEGEGADIGERMTEASGANPADRNAPQVEAVAADGEAGAAPAPAKGAARAIEHEEEAGTTEAAEVPCKEAGTVSLVRPAKSGGIRFEPRRTVATACCGRRRGARFATACIKLCGHPVYWCVAGVATLNWIGASWAALAGAAVPDWLYGVALGSVALQVNVLTFAPMSTDLLWRLLGCFDFWIASGNALFAAVCAALTIQKAWAAVWVAYGLAAAFPVGFLSDALPGRFRHFVQRLTLLVGAVMCAAAPALAFGDALGGLEDYEYKARGMTWSAASQLVSCASAVGTYCLRFCVTAMRHPDQLSLLKSRMRVVRVPAHLQASQEAYEQQLAELVAKHKEGERAEREARRRLKSERTSDGKTGKYATRVGAGAAAAGLLFD